MAVMGTENTKPMLVVRVDYKIMVLYNIILDVYGMFLLNKFLYPKLLSTPQTAAGTLRVCIQVLARVLPHSRLHCVWTLPCTRSRFAGMVRMAESRI